jgi:hypothetical protein
MAEKEDTDSAIAHLASTLRLGIIVAAAGCGKTEQIANATQLSGGRRLILTHTHAGVDVLRQRLKKLNVPRTKFRLDRIAGWCLRYAASFAARSGLVFPERMASAMRFTRPLPGSLIAVP